MDIKAPDISRFDNLDLKGHFAGRTGRGDPNSYVAEEKIGKVFKQENDFANMRMKVDNTPDDLNPEKGKMLRTSDDYGRNAVIGMDTYSGTDKPKKMQMTTDDGKFFSNVTWDEKGNIDHVLEERGITDGYEHTDYVTIDKNKDGTYNYEEGWVPGLDHGGKYIPGDHVNELA